MVDGFDGQMFSSIGEIGMSGMSGECFESLEGRSVVITGAGGGIGRALAVECAERGARVAVSDVDETELERVERMVRTRGCPVIAERCDVTAAAECEAHIERVEEAWGGVDVLVNNAGIAQRSLFEETEPEVLEQVMAVNYWGAVRMTRAALESLMAREGQIAVLSSVAGFAPLTGRTGYAASKHALHGCFESLATEVGDRGVGVTMVCPSFIDTGLDARALAGDGERVSGSRADVGGSMAPEALAEQVVAAVKARERYLLPTGMSRVAWWVSRLAPGVYRALMRRSVLEEFPWRGGS